MVDSDKVQFNIYLPRELVTRVKHRAIDEDERSLSSFVERILQDYLDNTKDNAKEVSR
jgi:metal-responsive CopG/Arc/MetJ family transcriptional regulator